MLGKMGTGDRRLVGGLTMGKGWRRRRRFGVVLRWWVGVVGCCWGWLVMMTGRRRRSGIERWLMRWVTGSPP